MSETQAPDVPRIRRNVEKMIGLGAPPAEIDAYLGGEGFTAESFRAANIEQRQPVPRSAGAQFGRAFGVTGRGLVEGAAALPGMVYDAAAVPVNLAASALGLPTARRASQNVSAVLDAAGVPTPENGPERLNYNVSNMVGGVGSTAFGPINALTSRVVPAVGNMLATAPGAQLAGAAGAGVAQSAAQSLAAPGWIEAPAAVAGGVLGAVAVPLVRGAANAGAALVRPWTQAGAEEAAGAAILRSATTPRELEYNLTRYRSVPVAGSNQTTAEVVNDPGMFQLERTLRAGDPAQGGRFAILDAERDAARATSARFVEPTASGAEDVNRAVRGSLTEAQQSAAALEARAQAAADERIAALGGRVDPQQAGTIIRQEFDAAYRQARGATREAYGAIGDLEVPLQPIGRAAFDAADRFYGPGGGAPPGAVTELLNEIRSTEGARVGFDWWQRFRSRASTEAAVAAKAGDNRAAAVFSSIRDGADEALDAAAAAGRTASPEQAAALAAAQDARRVQASRFETGAADQMRRTDYGRPVVPPAVVPGTFFRGGVAGQASAQQFIASVGDSAQALEAMRGFVVDRLLATATRPDGAIDPTRLAAFQRQYGGALREFPQLANGIRNAEEAARLLAQARASGSNSIADAERGVARFFLNSDPERAIDRVLNSSARVQDMRALRDLVSSDEAATSGLRRSFIDAWLNRSTSTALDASNNFRMSPAKAENFWRANAEVARVLFRPHEVAMFDNIARDFASGNRVNTVGKAVGSNTFQNATTSYVLGQVTGGTIDPLLMERITGGTAGRVLRLIYGGAERQVQDLLYNAMLEPEVARALVSRASPRNLSIVTGYLERTSGDRLRALGGDLAGQVAPAAINSGVQVARPDMNAAPQPRLN